MDRQTSMGGGIDSGAKSRQGPTPSGPAGGVSGDFKVESSSKAIFKQGPRRGPFSSVVLVCSARCPASFPSTDPPAPFSSTDPNVHRLHLDFAGHPLGSNVHHRLGRWFWSNARFSPRSSKSPSHIPRSPRDREPPIHWAELCSANSRLECLLNATRNVFGQASPSEDGGTSMGRASFYGLRNGIRIPILVRDRIGRGR